MDGAMIEEVKDQIVESDRLQTGRNFIGKRQNRIGVEDILNAIVERIPAPKGEPECTITGIDL